MKYRVLTKCTLIFVVLAGFGAGKLYGASVPKSAKPWPNATVTYHLDPVLLKYVKTNGEGCSVWEHWAHHTQAYKICASMHDWSNKTGIKLSYDKNKAINSLYIKHSELLIISISYFLKMA